MIGSKRRGGDRKVEVTEKAQCLRYWACMRLRHDRQAFIYTGADRVCMYRSIQEHMSKVGCVRLQVFGLGTHAHAHAPAWQTWWHDTSYSWTPGRPNDLELLQPAV